MDNSDILNNDVFISVYVIAMFFLPMFFIFSLTTANLSKGVIEFITMVVFLALTIILLILCITKIPDAVSMSNYLTIIFITMFIIPLFSLSYYSSINATGQAIGGQISMFWKLFGNLMTIALIICVVFLNLITAGAMNYKDAIPNPKNAVKDPFVALMVIASLIGVGILVYVLPLLYTTFKEWMLGPMPTVNAANIGASTMGGMAFLASMIKDIGINLGTIIDDFFNNIQKDIPTAEDKQNAFAKYGLLYGFIFIIGVILYISAFDENALTGKEYVYAFSAIIPLVVLMGFVIPFSTTQRSASSTILLIGIFATIFFGIIYSYSSMSATGFEYMSYFINFVMFLIVMFGLAIFFYIFSNYLKSIEGLLGFIIYFIFYIPCLLVSLVDRISRLFGMGGEGKKDSGLFKPSRTDYIVLISAVVLNVIYFTYPYVLNYFSKQGGLLLLNMPVYTNTENTLGSYIDLNNSETFAYTYAISFWVFIDSASPSMSHAYDKYTSLLNYGNKPNVLYNGKENTLMITMESPGSLTLSKDTKKAHVDDKGNQILYKKKGVLLQKWNHIVLNYTGGTMDIFFNGELEKSVDGVVPYMKYDTLTIGENNGLHGGICNVTYFNKSLTMNKIYYLYNYVKDYTPPVSENTDKTIIHIVKKDT